MGYAGGRLVELAMVDRHLQVEDAFPGTVEAGAAEEAPQLVTAERASAESLSVSSQAAGGFHQGGAPIVVLPLALDGGTVPDNPVVTGARNGGLIPHTET